MSDADVARSMEDSLSEQLAELQDTHQVKRIVCATHHQQYEQTVRRAGVLPWEFFNAFMGTRRMGEVIDEHPKIGHVIYGHTHSVGDRWVGSRRVFGTPLGYPRERAGIADEEIVRTRIGWIDF